MSREEIITQVERYFRKINKKFKNEINKLLEDISLSEYFVLHYLSESGPLKVSKIANQFNVSLPHVSALSDQLMKKKLIYRERSSEDRRAVVLGITPEGQEILEKMRKKKTQYIATLMKDVTDEELLQLLHIYKKMNASIE